jgi:hypothetical protein
MVLAARPELRGEQSEGSENVSGAGCQLPTCTYDPQGANLSGTDEPPSVQVLFLTSLLPHFLTHSSPGLLRR